MKDLCTLQHDYKIEYRVRYVFLVGGALLFGSSWGIRAWLLGLGLILYGTTWDRISKLELELVERLDALKAAKSN